MLARSQPIMWHPASNQGATRLPLPMAGSSTIRFASLAISECPCVGCRTGIERLLAACRWHWLSDSCGSCCEQRSEGWPYHLLNCGRAIWANKSSATEPSDCRAITFSSKCWHLASFSSRLRSRKIQPLVMASQQSVIRLMTVI